MRNYNTVNQEFEHTVMKSGDVHIGKLFFQYLYFLLVMSGGWGIARADILAVPSSYATIQQAINAAAPGDRVSVAPGTYVEKINFLGKAITVQSQSGPEATIIDGNKAGSVVTFSSGEGLDSKLEGFTVQNGLANFGNGYGGGGIRIYSSSPTVFNNHVINNNACTGLGIDINFGSPLIEHNQIRQNTHQTCSGGNGGGIRIGGDGSAKILDNIIADNSSESGAGISLFAAGTPLIRNNFIIGNSTTGRGGGIWMVNYSDAVIMQNLIYGNRAAEGGGIYWLVPSGATGPLLLNNTIANNNAITGQGSGIYADGYDANTRLVNNIVTGMSGQSAIYCGDFNDTNSPIFHYNDVFNSDGNAFGGICSDPTGLSGNISVDPLFADAQEADFCLTAGSPAIDTGENNQDDLPSTDLVGGVRIRDGDSNGSAIVDMGAYEHDVSGAGVLTFSSATYATNETTNSFLVTVSRHCGSSGEVTVAYNTADGTATASSDYQDSSGTLTLHEGESSSSFSIPIFSDALVEGDESVILTLNNPTGGATLGRISSAKLIIRDTNSTVRFSAATYSASETDDSKMIEVIRDNSQNEVTVNYSTSDGTAEAGMDYTAVSGTLIFAAGQTSASFTVPILIDSEEEIDETVLLNLSNPLNGAVLGSPASAELTIRDANVLTRDYFPITPGSEWKYIADGSIPFSVKVPFESVTINKIKTRILKNGIDGSKAYFTNDSQGIRLHRLYASRISVQGYGVRSLILTAYPPVLLAAEGAEIGQTFDSQGDFRASIPGLGSALLPYTASYTIQGYDTVTVPAGTYNVIKLQGSIILATLPPISETYYLAKYVGIVKQETNSFGVAIASELQETNTGIHDLAVTSITPPGKVVLTDKKPVITKTVKVTIQNRSPLLETITDSEMLEQFVHLNIESLGVCPVPITKLLTEKLQKHMPINLKPKQNLSVYFEVTFNCANDPEASTRNNPGHEDYRYTAKVDNKVLDGYADVHEADDVCPRAVTPPYVVDDYPDGKIKDRGCGAKKPDKTFGADVITDVLGP